MGAAVLSIVVPISRATPEFQIISISSGQTVDAYLEINASGTVFVSIRNSSQDQACADFWWITWPFGSVKNLGRQCGSADFEIPGISALALSAKLRVGGVIRSTKIVVADNATVARSVTVSFP